MIDLNQRNYFGTRDEDKYMQPNDLSEPDDLGV